mmetsp:Transcript_22191/g.51186  ORF Transcript_22191/g.51186 Transcript_22191/m.51186 type:complete len:126 (+) Transcript_22191:624-1001(+)
MRGSCSGWMRDLLLSLWGRMEHYLCVSAFRRPCIKREQDCSLLNESEEQHILLQRYYWYSLDVLMRHVFYDTLHTLSKMGNKVSYTSWVCCQERMLFGFAGGGICCICFRHSVILFLHSYRWSTL